MTDRILRLPEVRHTTGLPTSTIYYMIKRKEFPEPIKLGARAVGWRLSEIEKWFADRELARMLGKVS